MSQYIFYPINRTAAVCAAAQALKTKGYGVVDRPCESITHILLPVPSFDAQGNLKGGGDLDGLLPTLSSKVVIIGGNIPKDHFPNHNIMDLLQDAQYLADNAAISAYCALRLAMMELPVMLRGCKTLILGWGRIGKCLAALLKAMDADVTVAARKGEDRAIAHALGYHTKNIADLGEDLNGYRLIFNTVPAPILSEEQTEHCTDQCVKIDLATRKGIEGRHTIWARGLPGKDTPESSGKLIAKTIVRLLERRNIP